MWRFARYLLLFVAALSALAGVTPRAAVGQVNWTASGPGTSWATGTNWSNGSGPGTTDIARFASAGATNSPVVITNTVDASRAIGGLVYETSGANFQDTNLAGFTLTVAGDLDSGFDIFANTTNYIKGRRHAQRRHRPGNWQRARRPSGHGWQRLHECLGPQRHNRLQRTIEQPVGRHDFIRSGERVA